jgi:hypothetical protein
MISWERGEVGSERKAEMSIVGIGKGREAGIVAGGEREA